MPVIIVEGPKVDIATRRGLARDLTQVASRAFGLPKETIVVIFHEDSPECVSSGGELICDLRPPAEESGSARQV